MEEGEEIRTELVLSLNYKNTKENAFQWRNLYIKQFGVPTYPPPMPPNPATTNAEYPSRHDIPGLICVDDDGGMLYNTEEENPEHTYSDASSYAGRSSSRITRKSHFRSSPWRELGTSREVLENLELFSSHMFEFLLPKRRSRRHGMHTSRMGGSLEVPSLVSPHAFDDPNSTWRTNSVKEGRHSQYGPARSGISFAMWDQRPELKEKMNPHNIPRELLALQHNAWMLLMDNRPLAWLERDLNQKGSTMDQVRSKLLAIATSSHALSSSSSWKETSEEELAKVVIPPLTEEAAENRVFESFSPYFTVISSPAMLHQLQERFHFSNRLPVRRSLFGNGKEGETDESGGVARMENMVGYPLFSQYASWRETYENRKVWNCAPFSFFLIYDTSYNYAQISALFVMLELIHHHGHTHSLKCLGQLEEPISLEEASQHFLQKKNVRDQLEKRRTLCPLIAMQKSMEDIILAYEQSSSRTTLTMMKQVSGFLTECVLEPEVSQRFLSQDALFRQADFTLPGLQVTKVSEASPTMGNGANPSESFATANRSMEVEKKGEKEIGSDGHGIAESNATGEENDTVNEGKKKKMLPSVRASRKKKYSATRNESMDSTSYVTKSSVSLLTPSAAHLSPPTVLPTLSTTSHNTSALGVSTFLHKHYSEKDLDVLFHLSYWFIDAATANSRIPIDPYLLPPTPAERWRQDKPDSRDPLPTGSPLTTPTTGGGGGAVDAFSAAWHTSTAYKSGRSHPSRGAGVPPPSSSSSSSRPHGGTPSTALAPPFPRSLSPYPALSSSSSSSAPATAAARGGGEKDARHPTTSPPASTSIPSSMKHLVREHLYLPGRIQAYAAVGSVVDVLILYHMRLTALSQWMTRGDPTSPMSPLQSIATHPRHASGAGGVPGSPGVSASWNGSPNLFHVPHTGGGGGGGGGKSKRGHPLPRSGADPTTTTTGTNNTIHTSSNSSSSTTLSPSPTVSSPSLSGMGAGGRLPTEAEYRSLHLSPSTTLLTTPLILLTTYIRLHGGAWLKHIFGRLFNILRRESVVLYVNRLDLEDPFFAPSISSSAAALPDGSPASRSFPIEDSSTESASDSNNAASEKVSRTLAPAKHSTLVDALHIPRDIQSHQGGSSTVGGNSVVMGPPTEGHSPPSLWRSSAASRGRDTIPMVDSLTHFPREGEERPTSPDVLRASSGIPSLFHSSSASPIPSTHRTGGGGEEEGHAGGGIRGSGTGGGGGALAESSSEGASGQPFPIRSRASLFYDAAEEKNRRRHSSIAELGTFRKRMERLEDLIAQDIIFVMNEFFHSLYGKRSATRLPQGITALVTQFCTSLHFHILSNIVSQSDVSHNPLVVTMVHRVMELVHALKKKQMTAKAFRPQVISDFHITRLITTIEQLRLSKFILFDCWIIPSLNNIVSLGYLSENSSTHLRWNIDAFARYLKILVNGPFTEGDKRAFISARGGGVVRQGSTSEMSGSLGGHATSGGGAGGAGPSPLSTLPPLARAGSSPTSTSPPPLQGGGSPAVSWNTTPPPDVSNSSVLFHPLHRRTHTGGVTGGGTSKSNATAAVESGGGGGSGSGGGGGGGGPPTPPSIAISSHPLFASPKASSGGAGGGESNTASAPPFTLSIPSYITGIYDVSSGCLVRLFTDVDLTSAHTASTHMSAFLPHENITWWAAHRGSQAASSAHGGSVGQLSEVSLSSGDTSAADRSPRHTIQGTMAGAVFTPPLTTTATTSSSSSISSLPAAMPGPRGGNTRPARHSSAISASAHMPSLSSGGGGGGTSPSQPSPPQHSPPHPGWTPPAPSLPTPAALSKSLFAKNLYYRVMDTASWEDMSSRMRGLNERLGLHDYEPDEIDELGLVIGGTSGFLSPSGTGENRWSYNASATSSPSSPDTVVREEYCAMRMLDAFCRRSSTENTQNVVVSEYDVHPAMAVTCTDKVYEVMAGTHPLVEQSMQDSIFPGKYSYSPYVACLSGVLLHPQVALHALENIRKNSRRFYSTLMRPMSHPTFLNMVDALIQSGNELPLVDTNSLAPLLATVKPPASASTAPAGGTLLRVYGKEEEAMGRGEEEDCVSDSGQSDEPHHSPTSPGGGGERGGSVEDDPFGARDPRPFTGSDAASYHHRRRRHGGGGGGRSGSGEGSPRGRRALLLSASQSDSGQETFLELEGRSLLESSHHSSGSDSSSSSGQKPPQCATSTASHMKLLANVRKLQIQQSFLLTGCPVTPLSTRLLLRRAGPFSPYKLLIEGEAAIARDTGVLPSTFDPWWRAMVFALCVKATNVIRECDNAQSTRFEDWCRGQLEGNRKEGRLATNAFVLTKGVDTSPKTAGMQPTPTTQGSTKRIPLGATTTRRRRRGGGNRSKPNPGSNHTATTTTTTTAAAAVTGSTGGTALGDGAGARKDGGDAATRGRLPRGDKEGRRTSQRKISPAIRLGVNPEIQRLFKRAATGPLPPSKTKERFPFQR